MIVCHNVLINLAIKRMNNTTNVTQDNNDAKAYMQKDPSILKLIFNGLIIRKFKTTPIKYIAK